MSFRDLLHRPCISLSVLLHSSSFFSTPIFPQGVGQIRGNPPKNLFTILFTALLSSTCANGAANVGPAPIPVTHDWAGLIEAIAEALTAAFAVFAVFQLYLFKKDIRLRNERAAKEKAIEYADRYARCLQLFTPFDAKVKAAELGDYRGPIGDFSPASIPKPLLKVSIKRYEMYDVWAPALNELVVIAAAFADGVADERTGFKIFGRGYCSTVRTNYDLIAISRHQPSAAHLHYQPIVDLYRVWSSRLSKAELESARNQLAFQIKSHPDLSIPPIGCE